MTKTFNICLILLGLLLLLQRAEAQSAQPESAQSTTAEQKQPAEDPLGRSTPHGTVVGLIAAAEQGNLDRAAEYLASGLSLQTVASWPGSCGSFSTASSSRAWIA